jgi:tetratricopeptide (TPR) repeat protein
VGKDGRDGRNAHATFEYPVENDSRRNVLTAEALMTDPILTALHQATLLASHSMSAEKAISFMKTSQNRQSTIVLRNLLRRVLLVSVTLGGASYLPGCSSTPGARPSIWPTKTIDASATGAATGVTGTIASTSKAVKGQFASMGTAVSSAYGKAKTAITSPFSASDSPTDPAIAATPGAKPTIGPELYVMNGQLHESQGNYAKAIDSFSKALEIEPKNPAALLSTARLYERQNEKEKAVQFYQKAAEVAPNAAVFADLGNLQARNGNLVAAKDQLQKAVNLDSKNTTYRSALAGVLLDSGQTDSAMSELMQVNSPAMANYQMAYLHFARKNVPATQQYLGNALQIDPNLKPARDLMASMGGAQNISQMAQQGQSMVQQAQGIYQQAGARGSNIQGLMNTAPVHSAPQMQLPPATSNSVGFSPGATNMPPYENASGVNSNLRR